MKKKGQNKDGITPEDSALWQQVAKSVRAYHQAQNTPAKPKKTAAAKEAPAPLPVPPDTIKKTGNKGFDTATETKFRRGQLPVEGRIDLHGMTQVKAHDALMRFITSAAKTGKRTLLVITGKGRLSEGGGVLRRMLPLWLEENPHVLALTPAQPKDGGGGAFYLRLRKKKT